jgi:hypothetical protein
MPAEEAIQVGILLGLMQTFLLPPLYRILHGRHIKDKKKLRLINFTFDGRSRQTGDAAFTPAASKE